MCSSDLGTELRFAITGAGRNHGWLILGGAVLLCGLAGLMLARRFGHDPWWTRQRSGGPTTEQVAAFKIYSRMLKLLGSRGLQKAPGMTPLEFAHRIAGEWKAAGEFVNPITELYCCVRFGQVPLSPDDLARAQGWLAGLRMTPR